VKIQIESFICVFAYNKNEAFSQRVDTIDNNIGSEWDLGFGNRRAA